MFARNKESRARGLGVYQRPLNVESLEARQLLATDLSLVTHFDLWDGGLIKSTDVSGITSHPSGRLFIADSEINELPEFEGYNVFQISKQGNTLYSEIESNNDEPTGITYNNFDDYFYITNDDTKLIGRYDDNLNSPLLEVDTRDAVPSATDPEGITSDPATGDMYVVDGSLGGMQVLKYNSNLVFQSSFSIDAEADDGEGIAFDTGSQHLFVVSSEDEAVFEYTTSGSFIRSYDISGFSPAPVAPQGITFAQTSDPTDDPSNMAVYIADGMIDNFPDGRVYEAVFSDTAPSLPGETVEAEDGILSGLMAVKSHSSASGGKYVSAPTGTSRSSPGSDYVEFEFQVDAAGDFRIDGRVDGKNSNQDSFFVTVDGLPPSGYVWNVPDGWITDSVSDEGGADPVILSLGTGVHTVRVHLREGGTFIDTITLVEVSPPMAPALPGEIVEAEDGLLSGEMTVRTDGAASGGEYVAVDSNIYASAPANDYVEFVFLVQSAGDFRLDAVVDGPSGSANSFFATINGSPSSGHLWDIPSGWTTDSVSDRGSADPVILALGVGTHVVRVHLREGGARLDTIVLVDISPTVYLPGQTVEAEAGLLTGRMAIQTDASASGGQYVAAPSDEYAFVPGNDYAEFRFQVQSAGSFRLDAVVDGPAANADSFFITVDDQPAGGYLWDIPSGWTTSSVKDRGTSGPVILSLGTGQHVVRFHLREGGARLDSLVMVGL